MKDLQTLLEGMSYTVSQNCPALDCVPIKEIAYHSGKAGRDTLFVCLTGYAADGHDFAEDAYRKGSRYFLCERPLSLPEDAHTILVENTRKALALCSAALFDHPERKLRIIGVTGTKGKSTVCEMIYHILTANGISAGLIGTVGAKIGGMYYPTDNTTPESYVLFRFLSQMVDVGAEYAILEASSQGIKMHRLYGISFAVAVMTNLSRDHIGVTEHPDFEDYKAAKLSLFRNTRHVVLCLDDTYYGEFAAYSNGEITTFSTEKPASLSAWDIVPLRDDGFGVSFLATAEGESVNVRLSLPGRFSVSNALAALSVCRLCGVSLKKAAPALASFAVKGRFEIVKTPLSDVTFVIDYAHNGESLRHALMTLRDYASARLICLFGSIGERTKCRRADMGSAARLADFAILTSDDPHGEPPMDIIHDIEEGMGDTLHIAIPDRRAAIEYAVSIAEAGDIILFAGKGHEEYQHIGTEKVPFSEREILQNAVLTLRAVMT